mgnify:FL=1
MKNRLVYDVGFSVRVSNCLHQLKIETVEQLITAYENDSLCTKNFGETSYKEVLEFLNKHNLISYISLQKRFSKLLTILLKEALSKNHVKADTDLKNFIIQKIEVLNDKTELILPGPIIQKQKDESRKWDVGWASGDVATIEKAYQIRKGDIEWVKGLLDKVKEDLNAKLCEMDAMKVQCSN